MASKYIQKYPIPEGFAEVLHDFTREVLRDQPEDILSYAASYFECLNEGKPFKFDSKFNIKKEDQKNIKSHKYQEGYSQKQGSGVEAPQQQHQKKEQHQQSYSPKSQSQQSERPQSQISKKSGGATSHQTEKEQVKMYMAELSEGLMDLSGLNSSKHEREGSQDEGSQDGGYRMMNRGMTHETIKEVGRNYVENLTGVSQSQDVFKRASQVTPNQDQDNNINIQDQQNMITGQFYVNIMAARNLQFDQEVENDEDVETYCIAMLTNDPTRLIKTDYATGSNPLWNQKDKFLISLSEEQIADTQLNIQIYDGNKVCLGEVSLECQTQFLNVHKWFNKFVEVQNPDGNTIGSVYLQTLWVEDGQEEVEVAEPEDLLQASNEEQIEKGIFYINIVEAQGLDVAEEEQIEIQAMAFLSHDPQNYIQSEKYSEEDKQPKWNVMNKLYVSLRSEEKADSQLIVQIKNGKMVIGESSIDVYAVLNEGAWISQKFELTNMRGEPGYGSIVLQAKWVVEGQELGEIPEVQN